VFVDFGLHFDVGLSIYRSIYKPKLTIMDTFLLVLFAISFTGFIIGIVLLYKLLTDSKRSERVSR